MAAMAKPTSNSPRSLTYMYSATLRVPPLRVKAEKILFATTVPTPAVNSSAALSPTIRPMDKMQPVTMPSTEEGRMMVRIMYHFVAPRPSAPSR